MGVMIPRGRLEYVGLGFAGLAVLVATGSMISGKITLLPGAFLLWFAWPAIAPHWWARGIVWQNQMFRLPTFSEKFHSRSARVIGSLGVLSSLCALATGFPD